jgi:integrase/recombinase XerD
MRISCADFLNFLGESRGNAAQSRNLRLAALRTFFECVGERFPERLGQAQRVAAIPKKRIQLPETIFLERDEIEGTLAALPADGWHALRDRTLLLFLYNTGARGQEAADLRATDLRLGSKPIRASARKRGQMAGLSRVGGNGFASQKAARRTRAKARAKPTRLHRPKERGVDSIRNLQGGPTLHQAVIKHGSDGRLRGISPHVWKHGTAVHLLEAGVEVNVIRAWLGHSSLETTNRYAEITLRTKQAALEKCMLPVAPDQRIPRKPLWQTDTSLLKCFSPCSCYLAGKHVRSFESGSAPSVGHITGWGTFHGHSLLRHSVPSAFSVETTETPCCPAPVFARRKDCS